MSVLDITLSGDNVRFDENNCVETGAKYAEEYRAAAPFPHILLEDFIDEGLLKHVYNHYPKAQSGVKFDRTHEKLKYQYHPEKVQDDLTRNLLYALNSEPFIKFLSSLTGIKGLIPDTYFAGGGLHETRHGGKLGIHADFNIHGTMQLKRRLNILIYLNENWDKEFGGYLELWDKEMKACVKSVKPELGNCLIFNTDLDSYHGHPDPLTCGNDRSRRSIAMYYYTAVESDTNEPRRTTNFRVRPDSTDKRNLSAEFRHFLNDWVPPALRRLKNK